MLYDRLLSKLGKSINHNDVKPMDVISYAWNKSYPGILKTLFYRIFLKKAGRMFLVGKKTRIVKCKKLTVGSFCYIGDYSYINCLSRHGVTLGNRVTLREFTWMQVTSDLSNIGEGIKIGDNTYIGPRSILGAAGWITIGENCQIGANVQFIAENHVFSDNARAVSEQGVTRKGISVGKGCWIGNNAIILDGVNIGDGVIIGAGSVVTKSLEAGGVYVGNPATLLKKR